MRAPPESLSPTTGAPAFIARSITLQTFAAFVSESEPPKTVKSCAKTKTGRPSTRIAPATTPSPGYAFASLSIPKSRQRWTTNGSISSKEPGSARSSTRSRAESLPDLCCFSRRSRPPPRREAVRRSSSRWRRASRVFVTGSSSRVSSQGDLLFFGEHPLRLSEHLGLVDAGRTDRGRVLEEEPLHLFVELPFAVAVELEHGLDRTTELGGRRAL